MDRKRRTSPPHGSCKASKSSVALTQPGIEFKASLEGLWIGPKLFTEPFPATRVAEIIGLSPRVAKLPKGLEDWRDVWIFDDAGFYVLRDLATGNSVAFTFAWCPEESAFPPAQPFKAQFLVNGMALRAGMKADDLPLSGPVAFTHSYGKNYSAAFTRFYISLNLKRRRLINRRRSGAPVLCTADFCFSEGSIAPEDISVRLAGN